MNNTNLKFVIGSRPLSDGNYGLYLRITKNRRKKEINVGLRCQKNSFENEKFLKSHKNHFVDNEVLTTIKAKALKIIREFQIEDNDFTLEDFELKFRGNSVNSPANIISLFDELILEMRVAGRTGNANVYVEAKDALIRYKGKKIMFSEVTPAFLDKFESFMRGRGNIDSGISIKMRTIRAVFNKAIERELVKQEQYPFSKYKVSKLKTKSSKRAMSVNEFKQIKSVDLDANPHLIDSYNYFMFSFYTRGMNFVDMMNLKWGDLDKNRIIYVRSKTKTQMSVEITPKVKEILNHYKNQKRNSPYVFPILLKSGLTPTQIANRKKKVLGHFNSQLKELGRIAGVETKLTSYVARHSFATILKQIGTSTDVISELMGHADVQITMTYLKEFDTEFLDQENRRLLDL